MPTYSSVGHALQFGNNSPTVTIVGTDYDGYIIYDMSTSGTFYQFAPNTKYFALQVIFDSPFQGAPGVLINAANATTAAYMTAQPGIEFYIDQGDVDGYQFKISGISSSTPQLGATVLVWSYQTSGIKLSDVPAHAVIDGYTVDLSGGATNGSTITYNGASFIALNDFVNVESFRATGFTDAQTIQAAVNAGVPLVFPQRTYTINAGETIINTSCHFMLGLSTTLKIGPNAIVNTDGSFTNFTPFMQTQGIQGFYMMGSWIVDGNRDNQTYPATVNDFGRGVSGATNYSSAGRRTNGILEFVPDSTNTTPSSQIYLSGLEVKNGYLNGIVLWQAKNVVIDRCYTHDNTINGVSAEGVTNVTYTNCGAYRDGYSSIYTTTRASGDRAGFQAREIPANYTATGLGMPHIASTDGYNFANYNIQISNSWAEDCGVESWFMRHTYPGKITNCSSKNVGYGRLNISFNPAHYWGESGEYNFSNIECVQSRNNTASGWQNPDVLVCHTMFGNAKTGASGGAPVNIDGYFRSTISNLRATCGNDAYGNKQNNYNRGPRVFSYATMVNYYVEGTSAEAVRIENDINYNLLPPQDVSLIDGYLVNILADTSGTTSGAIKFNRFNNGGAATVVGRSTGIIINGLTVRDIKTATASSGDNHAIIDFDATMQTYDVDLTATNLDFDCTNSLVSPDGGGSDGYFTGNFNGVRPRCGSGSNIKIDFKKITNSVNPVRSYGFNSLSITGKMEKVHRLLLVDFDTTNSRTTANAHQLLVDVEATNVTSQLFFFQNFSTYKIGNARIRYDVDGYNTCRTFPSGVPGTSGNITVAADSFFAETSSFTWGPNTENYGSADTTTNVYDMRRLFSTSTTLNAATPYYVGEMVKKVDDSSVWIAKSIRQGDWANTSGSAGAATGPKIVPLGFPLNSVLGTPTIAGADQFNPNDYTGFTTIKFHAVFSNGNNTVSTSVVLHDATNNVDIYTTTYSGSTAYQVVNQTLTVSTAGTNTIANSAAIYEVRIFVNSPVTGGTNFIQLYSAEMRVS